MESNISKVVYIVILLIIIIAVVGMIFMIYSGNKDRADSSSVELANKMEQIDKSKFASFDQKVVTGAMVKSAVKDFAGKDIAIFIATRAYLKDQGGSDNSFYFDPNNNSASVNSIFDLTTSNGKIKNSHRFRAYYMDGSDEKGVVVTTDPGRAGNKTAKPLSFINYGSLLNKDPGKNTAGSEPNALDGRDIEYKDGKFVHSHDFRKDAKGEIATNNETGNLNRSTSVQYVPDGANFKSYLIVDLSGSEIGIAFQQIITGM